MSQIMWVGLEVRKGKKIDHPLELIEREGVLPTPWFYPNETCVGLLNYKMVR